MIKKVQNATADYRIRGGIEMSELYLMDHSLVFPDMLSKNFQSTKGAVS